MLDGNGQSRKMSDIGVKTTPGGNKNLSINLNTEKPVEAGGVYDFRKEGFEIRH